LRRLRVAATDRSVNVGGEDWPSEARQVSPLNHKLYTTFMTMADEEKGYPGSCGHMGKWHVGQFITWLENNYELKER
jgi:hypothetical protein